MMFSGTIPTATRRRLFYLLMYLCLMLQTCLGHSGHNLNLLHQNIDYHLGELKKNLHQLNAARIHKRSIDYDFIMYKSLTAFCSHLTSGGDLDLTTLSLQGFTQTPSNKTTTTHLVVSKQEKPKLEDFAHAHAWPIPEIFPLRVQAHRSGNKAYFRFHVSHKGPAEAFRSNSFDLKRYSIYYQENGNSTTPILSTVTLEADTSTCSNETRGQRDEVTYTFSLEDKNPNTFISLDIDACKFDKTGPGRRRIVSAEKNISQDIPLPMFRVLQDPGDVLTFQRRKNATIDVNITLDDASMVFFHASLWDYTSRNLLESYVHVTIPYEPEKAVTVESKQENGTENVLNVDIIKQENMKFTRNGEEKIKISVRIRVTVATAYKRRSGRLGVHYLWRNWNRHNATIVASVSTERVIWLKHPRIASYIPRNTVRIYRYVDKMGCDKNGMRTLERHGKNCTLTCRAFGTDITSILITKLGANLTPVKSVSHVIGTSAVAMIDVGPASRHTEGTYRCVVITTNGKAVKKDTHLYTSMFTDVKNVTVKDFANGSALITCTAFGEQPLNMSIETYDDNGNMGRVDDKSIVIERNEVTFGNYKNLTLILPTSLLKHPATSMTCTASGVRGSNSHYEYSLASMITDHNPSIPVLDRMPNATFMSNLGNGTVKIVCLATGGKPLEFWVTYGGASETYRIDLNPENVREVTETTKGARLSLLVPLVSLRGLTSWVDCRVGNKHGEDWHAMNTYTWGIL